jgi:hypothetical protein
LLAAGGREPWTNSLSASSSGRAIRRDILDVAVRFLGVSVAVQWRLLYIDLAVSWPANLAVKLSDGE